MLSSAIIAASLVIAAHVFGPLVVTPKVVMRPKPIFGNTVAWVLYSNAESRAPLNYVIYLSPYVVRAGLVCEAIVHEYGHLAGRGHTRIGVMRPVLQMWHGCDSVALRY